MVIFHERLKELRTEANLSQTELAKILGVNQRTISNWENGDRQPDFNMLEKIANYFHVSADYLLGLTN
ncbi:MAG TPA: helix-turn-helix domain-containing protein [Firmicutes bacterium]|nr:helix-turn-helix domain-containing protein [Bacillota bacterium]